MKNPVRVAERQALQELEKITLQTQIRTQVSRLKKNPKNTYFILTFKTELFVNLAVIYLNQRQWDASDWGGVHELFQILMKELKNKVELVLGVDDIPQSETH